MDHFKNYGRPITGVLLTQHPKQIKQQELKLYSLKLSLTLNKYFHVLLHKARH